MSKHALRPLSPLVKRGWRLINLVTLTIGFLIPVVHDRAFGIISYLNILFALLVFLPGVIFQAVTIPGKFPGLLLYLAGLVSLISTVLYLVLGIASCLRKNQRRTSTSLFLLLVSEIGAIVILFFWQDHLAQGAWLTVAALTSCFILELIERGSAKPRANR